MCLVISFRKPTHNWSVTQRLLSRPVFLKKQKFSICDSQLNEKGCHLTDMPVTETGSLQLRQAEMRSHCAIVSSNSNI